MRKLLAIFLIVASTHVLASENVSLKREIANRSFSWGAASIPEALSWMNQKSFDACPDGFEKIREYTTREGDKYFLHFEIRCLGNKSATVTPSTP